MEPTCRSEQFKNALLTGDFTNLPHPESREEKYLHSLSFGMDKDLPEPESLLDTLMYNTIKGINENLPTPTTNMEKYWWRICKGYTDGLPEPLSRSDWFDYQIAKESAFREWEEYTGEIINVERTKAGVARNTTLMGAHAQGCKFFDHTCMSEFKKYVNDNTDPYKVKVVAAEGFLRKTDTVLAPGNDYTFIMQFKIGENTVKDLPNYKNYLAINYWIRDNVQSGGPSFWDIRDGVLYKHKWTCPSDFESLAQMFYGITGGEIEIQLTRFNILKGDWTSVPDELIPDIKDGIHPCTDLQIKSSGTNVFNEEVTYGRMIDKCSPRYNLAYDGEMFTSTLGANDWYVDDYGYAKYFSLKPGVMYNMAFEGNLQSTILYERRKYGSDKWVHVGEHTLWAGKNIDFHALGNNGYEYRYWLRFFRRPSAGSVITGWMKNFRITEGSGVKPYQKYVEPQIIDIPGLELNGIGAIRDEFEWSTGRTRIRIKKMPLPNVAWVEDAGQHSENTLKYYIGDWWSGNGFNSNEKSLTVRCDKLANVSFNTLQEADYPCISSSAAGSLNIRIPRSAGNIYDWIAVNTPTIMGTLRPEKMYWEYNDPIEEYINTYNQGTVLTTTNELKPNIKTEFSIHSGPKEKGGYTDV